MTSIDNAPDFKKLAEQVQSALQLKTAPVTLRFTEDPNAAPLYQGQEAAGCVFWQRAAEASFNTNAKHHALCAVGAYTHNLVDSPEHQAQELNQAIQLMQGLDYIRDEEVQGIPVIKQSHTYVQYSPLAECTQTPDVVLLFARAQQSLILTEAAARVDKNIPPAMGRPACAAVPQAIENNRAAMSLGCCGARAYVDVLDADVALWAFPGGKFAAYAKEIVALAKANDVLGEFHRIRRGQVEAGGVPSYGETYGRFVGGW